MYARSKAAREAAKDAGQERNLNMQQQCVCALLPQFYHQRRRAVRHDSNSSVPGDRSVREHDISKT